MSSYTRNFYHAVFSTKHRAPLITPELEERLFPFMGGILADLDSTMLLINGMPEHVHLLVQYPSKLAHADMLRDIKARSSKWIHEEFPGQAGFAWQEGYGGFTVSMSCVPTVKEYIARQKEHHRRRSFTDEFLELLRKHEVDFDPATVFE